MSTATSASPNGPSPAPPPTAAGSRPTASTCSPSRTAASAPRTRSARCGRTCRPARVEPGQHSASDRSMTTTTSARFGAHDAAGRQALRPALRPAGRRRPGQRHAPMRRPTGSRPPARRRPTTARSRTTSTPTSSSSAPARPACRPRCSWREEHGIAGDGARSQPAVVGLLQPQRRPGPERERPAEALAVDRALGPRRRAPRSMPRSAAASSASRA